MKKVVALFDFDNTLIKGDSLPRFLWYFAPWIFIRKAHYIIIVLIEYALGRINNHFAKERLFAIFFAGTDNKKFHEKAHLFSKAVIPSLLRDEAVQRLEWHQERNHQCILVSASCHEYLEPWAEKAGFSKVLATKLEIDDNGILTGMFRGRNCTGPEKTQRVEEYLGSLDQFEIYAYGDSSGDMELLKVADHPFYKSFKVERPYRHE